MREYHLPLSGFDGAKFSQRYGLASFDFWVRGNSIFVPDNLPDPPIFEPPDPPGPSKRARLDGVRTLPELIELLKEVL